VLVPSIEANPTNSIPSTLLLAFKSMTISPQPVVEEYPSARPRISRSESKNYDARASTRALP